MGGRGLVYYNNYNMQTIYITKIREIGTSHGVIIPKPILTALKYQRGDCLVFGFAGHDQLFLRRLTDDEIRKIKPIIADSTDGIY